MEKTVFKLFSMYGMSKPLHSIQRPELTGNFLSTCHGGGKAEQENTAVDLYQD